MNALIAAAVLLLIAFFHMFRYEAVAGAPSGAGGNAIVWDRWGHRLCSAEAGDRLAIRCSADELKR